MRILCDARQFDINAVATISQSSRSRDLIRKCAPSATESSPKFPVNSQVKVGNLHKMCYHINITSIFINKNMFYRQIQPLIQDVGNKFPVMFLTGPRQSGKTTLLRALFPDYQYINLEFPDQLLLIRQDPREVLMRYQHGLIIDEAQNFPELFSWLQGMIDTLPKPTNYILSGSQNFLLTEKITQSLAGRVSIFNLLPLTVPEFCSDPQFLRPDLLTWLYNGAYPRPYNEHLPVNLWYESYIRTYLERDVRSIVNVRNLGTFQLFLKYCAGQHGQEFNASSIATALGLSQTTIMQWINILEASFIIFRLPPYYNNYRKRLSKRPKLYFYDSAIVCHLLGIESPEHLAIHTSRGAIFEGFVIAEIIKNLYSQGKTPALYYWREHSGVEIDLIIEQPQQLIAIETKSGITIREEYTRNLEKIQKTINDYPVKPVIVYGGDENIITNGIQITSWQDIANILKI